MSSEMPLVERQTSLATPGPSLLVRIGRYAHPHRTVRASASDGTCIRIGRHVLPYRPIRVSNSHLRAAEWREHETLWCLVECGRYCGSRWQRCGYLRVWFRKGSTLVRNLLQGLYLLVVLSRVVSRGVHLVARLLPQLCEKEELVGVVSHILAAG